LRFERPSFGFLAWAAVVAVVGARYYLFPGTPDPPHQHPRPGQLNIVARGTARLSTPATTPAAMPPAKAREREIFLEDAQRQGDPDLMRDYDDINMRYFGGSLPAVPVLWEPELAQVGPLIAPGFTLHGITDGRRILLNAALQSAPDRARATLCHEMAHIATTGTESAHGAAFQAVLRRLSEEGAFKGLWASQEEKRDLHDWLDREAARLNDDASELDNAGMTLQASRSKREADMADLDAKVAAANARGRGWPGDEDVAAVKARNDTFNEEATAYNARFAAHQAAAAHFNAEAERYNLMMAYPDGLDEETLVHPVRAAARNPQQ
jgi:hypothetical protein